jgi:predicted nucleotidyltransferase
VVSLDCLDPAVRAIVEQAARESIAAGGKAVLLTGSQARGTARPGSDIDLFVVGDGPTETHELIGDRMLSVHWWTPDEARQRMADPSKAFVAVFAWRDAVIVEDPIGVGAELKAVAEQWTWATVAREADAWIGDRMVELAEYASKLSRALEEGRRLDAAATRSQLALGLAGSGAVAHRVTARSQNGLWETIAESGDEEWHGLFERALGAGDEDVAASAEAALELFARLALEVDPILQPAQRQVLAHASKLRAGAR